jgi:biotin carboxyl carrier protein
MNIPLEIKIGDRIAKVLLLKKENNGIRIQVDDSIYDLDIVKVGNGLYSILIGDESFNVELIQIKDKKNYFVKTLHKFYDIEIIDYESKYLKNRTRRGPEEHVEKLFSPLPGRVVKILVKVGDHLIAGQTAIVIESMKMYSEFKVNKDRVIKEILVHEGDTVDTNQTMILFE